MVTSDQELKKGTRVRIRHAPNPVDLTVDTGTVLGPAEWECSYFVGLDKPAIYHHADGRQEELNSLRLDVDNLDVLAPGQ